MALAVIRRARISQTFTFAWTLPTISQTAFKHDLNVSAGMGCFPVNPHGLAFRTNAGFLCQVDGKLTGGNDGLLSFNGLLMTLAVGGFVLLELGVSGSKLVVGNIGVNPFFSKRPIIAIVGKAGIGRHNHLIFIDIVTERQSLVARLNAFKNGL